MTGDTTECSHCSGTGLAWQGWDGMFLLADCRCTRYGEVDLRHTADGEQQHKET